MAISKTTTATLEITTAINGHSAFHEQEYSSISEAIGSYKNFGYCEYPVQAKLISGDKVVGVEIDNRCLGYGYSLEYTAYVTVNGAPVPITDKEFDEIKAVHDELKAHQGYENEYILQREEFDSFKSRIELKKREHAVMNSMFLS